MWRIHEKANRSHRRKVLLRTTATGKWSKHLFQFSSALSHSWALHPASLLHHLLVLSFLLLLLLSWAGSSSSSLLSSISGHCVNIVLCPAAHDACRSFFSSLAILISASFSCVLSSAILTETQCHTSTRSGHGCEKWKKEQVHETRASEGERVGERERMSAYQRLFDGREMFVLFDHSKDPSSLKKRSHEWKKCTVRERAKK